MRWLPRRQRAGYHRVMKRASLLDVNPDLKDPAKLDEFLILHVATSTAIETGATVETIAKDLRQFLDAGMPAPTSRRR
jgi:hypothetical protein